MSQDQVKDSLASVGPQRGFFSKGRIVVQVLLEDSKVDIDHRVTRIGYTPRSIVSGWCSVDCFRAIIVWEMTSGSSWNCILNLVFLEDW